MTTRDASVHGKAAWQQPSDGSSPILTLASTMDNGNVTDAHLFLPRGLIAPSALAWLNRAFVAGRVPHAEVIFKGPVRQFPFHDGSGLFLARCNLDGMTLDYQEGWPRIENLTGQAEFRNEGMTARFTSARTGGITLDSADARFADFRSGELKVHAARTATRRRAAVSCAPRPSMRWRSTPSPRRGQGVAHASRRGSVLAVQGLRSPACAGARAIEGRDPEPRGFAARRDRLDAATPTSTARRWRAPTFAAACSAARSR